jgi:hypothetical protein
VLKVDTVTPFDYRAVQTAKRALLESFPTTTVKLLSAHAKSARQVSTSIIIYMRLRRTAINAKSAGTLEGQEQQNAKSAILVNIWTNWVKVRARSAPRVGTQAEVRPSFAVIVEEGSIRLNSPKLPALSVSRAVTVIVAVLTTMKIMMKAFAP